MLRLFWYFWGWELLWADLYRPIILDGEVQHHFHYVRTWTKREELENKRKQFIDEVESLRSKEWMLLNFTQSKSLRKK